MTQHIALYGKGGVGKTTLAANISAALVEAGFRVMLVGCDPDGDTTSLLHDGLPIPALQDRVRNQETITVETAVYAGYKGITCVELGLRSPGNLQRGLQELKRLQLFEQLKPDYILYDIPGDSSCTALHAVLAEVDIVRLFVVTTADFKALQSANEAFTLLELHNGDRTQPVLMGGLIPNGITSSFEESFVSDFAYHANARTIGKVPRSLVVRQCELSGKTVIESRPLSNQSYYYRRLANQIVDASGAIYSGNLPQPMSAERLRNWSREWADRIHALENGLVTDGAAI